MAGFEPCHFIVQGRDNSRQSFDPGSRPARGEIHFNSILVPKQSFSKGAVEALHNCLVPVDVSAPAANGCFVVLHGFCHSPHKLASRVDLQQLWPFQGTVSVYFRKASRDFIRLFQSQGFCSFVSAGHIHNCQGVFVNLFPMWELVMGQKKKVRLVHRIGQRDIKLGPRDVAWWWEVYLPQGLFNKPFFCHIFRGPSGSSKFFDSCKTFPVAPGTVVDLREFGIPRGVYTYGLQEAKGKIPSRKQASANEHEFASLLLRAGLVEVRKLGLFVVLDLLVALVHLIVPGQGYVGGFEVLARLVFHSIVGRNPVEELGAVFLVLCVGRLVLFQGYVVPGLLIQCGLAAIARQTLCDIVATSALRTAPRAIMAIETIVCIYRGLQTPGWASVRSQVVWKYFLVFQVFLQGDAASHDGGELDVVHQAGTRIASKVFFDDCFYNPPNSSDKASDGCGIEDRFDELVVRHGVCILRVYFLRFVPGALSQLCVWFRVFCFGFRA